MQQSFLPFLTTFVCFYLCLASLQGQDERKNIGDVLNFHVQFGVASPLGDLSDRFGNTLSLGTGMDYITEKSNYIFGVKADFQFGNEVKENIFGNIISNDGFIYGLSQQHASDFQLKQRGLYIGGHVGKIFPISKDNARSGIRLTLGAGLYQHRIRLQQDANNFVPQLADNYAKGYDRLTNGLALRQFAGYQLLGKDKLLNFMVGIEFVQGFTKNRRDYNFNEMQQDTTSRFDGYIGVKIGWTLPIYIGESTGEIYY